MKNPITSWLLMFLVAGSLASCRDESKLPAPKIAESLPLIFPQISSDPAKNHFDFTRTRASENSLATMSDPTRPVFEFTIDLDNTRDKKVKAVEVYKSLLTGASFGGTNGTVFTGGSFGRRVLVGTYTSFPATISLTSKQALDDLQRVIPQTGTTPPALPLPYLLSVKPANPTVQPYLISITRGTDAVVFTFEYILEDDTRIVLTPVNRVSVTDKLNGTTSQTVDVLATTTQVNSPFSAVAVIRD